MSNTRLQQPVKVSLLLSDQSEEVVYLNIGDDIYETAASICQKYGLPKFLQQSIVDEFKSHIIQEFGEEALELF